MSKPQMAAEPSMEEILASIRKMISDDKPGPSPLPDNMGRALFGESISRNAPAAEANVRGSGEPGGAHRTGAASGQGFNSLSDALKVATALSDPRRPQQDSSGHIEKGPRNNLEALTELSTARGDAGRFFTEERKDTPASNGYAPLQSDAKPGNEPLGQSSGAKQDLLSFDFGTMVPQRDGSQPKPAAEAKKTVSAPVGVSGPAQGAASVTPEAKSEQVASKPETPAETRVLPLRTGLNGSGSHGLNGSAINVAPFPRPMRDVGKVAEADAPAAAAPAVEETAPVREEAAVEAPKAISQPATEAEPAKMDALGKHGEALLDAVVELVQQQPNALSVFASGDSFISGVGGKKPAAELSSAIAEVAASTPAVLEPSAPKMDRAAAELLRPMLRQWLAENMERILEEALRSELTGPGPGGKAPGKS